MKNGRFFNSCPACGQRTKMGIDGEKYVCQDEACAHVSQSFCFGGGAKVPKKVARKAARAAIRERLTRAGLNIPAELEE
jgi:hypothetical protein